MASHGRELLGEHYNDEHLTYEEMTELGLTVVTGKGETIPTEELQDLPHSRPGRCKRLGGEQHGEHRHSHGPLLPAGVVA